MTTFNGVRIEAERRRLLNRDRIKIRDLVQGDFSSYEALERATGVDFRQSDELARRLGVPEENLAINAISPEAPDGRATLS